MKKSTCTKHIPHKDDVEGDWETVTTYGVTYEDGDDTNACNIEVQIAEHDGFWFVKTTDDAGGPDDAPDTAYASEAAAIAAAKELAEENDECDGLDAEDWLEREKEQAIEEGKDADGDWVLAHNDGMRWDSDRYASREAAELAIGAWYDRVREKNSGTNLLWHMMDTPGLARLTEDGKVELVRDEE